MTSPPGTGLRGEGASDDGSYWVTAGAGARGFRVQVTARKHGFTADEPRMYGGADLGPTPYEYLLGALGSCTAMTVRMYADRKHWPLDAVSVHLRQTRPHEPDCEHCEAEKVGITRIEEKIDLVGALSDEQRRRLLEIAGRCPVKQTLAASIEVVRSA